MIQALTVFLFKVRTGSSNKLLISLFNIDNEQSISDFFKSIIQSFEKDVLTHRFGLNSVNRNNLIQNHTIEISEKLFDVQDNLLLIYDGTYASYQKSTNKMNIQENIYLDRKRFLFVNPSLFV